MTSQEIPEVEGTRKVFIATFLVYNILYLDLNRIKKRPIDLKKYTIEDISRIEKVFFF